MPSGPSTPRPAPERAHEEPPNEEMKRSFLEVVAAFWELQNPDSSSEERPEPSHNFEVLKIIDLIEVVEGLKQDAADLPDNEGLQAAFDRFDQEVKSLGFEVLTPQLIQWIGFLRRAVKDWKTRAEKAERELEEKRDGAQTDVGTRDARRRNARRGAIGSSLARGLWTAIGVSVDMAFSYKAPLLLAGGLAGAGVSIRGCLQDRAEAKLTSDAEETVRVFMQGSYAEGAVPVYYHYPEVFDPEANGRDISIPLTEEELEHHFYYGALAIEALEDDFSIEVPVLTKANHMRLAPGVHGVDLFSWVYWGFVKGVRDERITIGHELVLAATVQHPWISDEHRMAYVDEDGEIQYVIDHPEHSNYWDLDSRQNGTSNDRWVLQSYYKDDFSHELYYIDLSDREWVSLQDHQWGLIQETAVHALDTLIEEGKILEDKRDDEGKVFDYARNPIVSQIESARPKSWQQLKEEFPYDIPKENPAYHLRSPYDQVVAAAMEEVAADLAEIRNHSVLKRDVRSIYLTVDLAIQDRVWTEAQRVMNAHPNQYQRARLGKQNFQEDHNAVRLLAFFPGIGIKGFFDSKPSGSDGSLWQDWLLTPPISQEFHTALSSDDCYVTSTSGVDNWLNRLNYVQDRVTMAYPTFVDSYVLSDGTVVSPGFGQGRDLDLDEPIDADEKACAEKVYDEGRTLDRLTALLEEHCFEDDSNGDTESYEEGLGYGDYCLDSYYEIPHSGVLRTPHWQNGRPGYVSHRGSTAWHTFGWDRTVMVLAMEQCTSEHLCSEDADSMAANVLTTAYHQVQNDLATSGHCPY